MSPAVHRPTPSFVRAVLLAAGTALLALVTGRPELVVLAAPFVVWCVVGVLGRPRATEPPPSITVSARALAAGEAVAVTARAGRDGASRSGEAVGAVVDLSLAPAADVELDPMWGATCGVDATTVKARPRRWGRFDLGEAIVVASDPRGLWQTEVRVPLGVVDVAPTATVPGRGDAIPHPIGVAGIHHSRRAGDGSALADIRVYVPGDRLTRINWRVTARTGSPHTNATTADRDTDVLIVLDTLTDATSAQMPGEFASSLDATVVAAASLAEHYLRLGDRVAVHDLGGLVADLPPRAGIRQFAVLSSRFGGVRRDDRVQRALRPVRRLRPGTFAVVCSPLLDEQVRGEISALVRRGAAVLVVDTLPARLGRIERGTLDRPRALQAALETSGTALWEEAWALRRLQRAPEVARLRDAGIPVAPWRGVGGVGALAAALAAQRPTARSGRMPG